MKIISVLPEKKHYKPIDSVKEGRWLFQDRGTSLLRIISPVPSPWSQEWVILFSFQQNKSDLSSGVNRLNLRLFNYDPDRKEQILKSPLIRENFKAKFPHTNAAIPSVIAVFFPREDTIENNNIWIGYTVLAV